MAKKYNSVALVSSHNWKMCNIGFNAYRMKATGRANHAMIVASSFSNLAQDYQTETRLYLKNIR